MRFLFVLFALASALAQTRASAPITDTEAGQLEASLVSNPNDSDARSKLLRYYFTARGGDAARAREARRRHILWLIRNQPDSSLLAGSYAALVPKGHLADPEGCAEAEKLWREHAAKPFLQPRAAANAIEFFKVRDRSLAVRLSDENRKRFPEYTHLGHLRGTLDALSVTGATEVDVYGYATAFDDDPRTSLEARRAREELESTSDLEILLGAGLSLANQSYYLHSRKPAAAQQALELAERCYQRALEKRPGDQIFQERMALLYSAWASPARDVKERVRLLEKGATYAHTDRSRGYLLGYLAEAHFENGQIDAAARDADELLQIAKRSSSSDLNYGNGIHDANIILGRVALKKENVAEARERLIAAGKTPGSPTLDSFGPKWTLAQELLNAGEKDVVLEYISLCGSFWKSDNGHLDTWASAIRSGGTPDFRRRVTTPAKLVGAAAPGFRLKDLGGTERELDAYKGKVVLLDFWATWCAPCRQELPHFEKLHRQLASKDVAILAVNVGEDQDTVADFIRKQKYTFPVLLAEEREVPNKYSVSAYPTLVVVNKAGRVADYLVGGRAESQLLAAIEKGRSGASESAPPAQSTTRAELPAPVLVSPPDGAVFYHSPRQTLLTWAPVPGAAGYAVEYACMDGTEWRSYPVKLVTDPMFQFEFAGAQPGRWRVWAVSPDGGASTKSAWREFRYTR